MKAEPPSIFFHKWRREVQLFNFLIIYQAAGLALPVSAAFQSPSLPEALHQQQVTDHFSLEVTGDPTVLSADK